jgi:2-polyprenyl-6-methoxyphenol hydroxylase-like FAD-dependent oxidoreductase
MVPFAGQGGCQAIEDCASLTNHLLARSSIPDALEGYRAERFPKVAKVVKFSMDCGKIQMDRRWWMELLFKMMINLVPDSATAYMMKWMYGSQEGVKILQRKVVAA